MKEEITEESLNKNPWQADLWLIHLKRKEKEQSSKDEIRALYKKALDIFPTSVLYTSFHALIHVFDD